MHIYKWSASTWTVSQFTVPFRPHASCIICNNIHVSNVLQIHQYFISFLFPILSHMSYSYLCYSCAFICVIHGLTPLLIKYVMPWPHIRVNIYIYIISSVHNYHSCKSGQSYHHIIITYFRHSYNHIIITYLSLSIIHIYHIMSFIYPRNTIMFRYHPCLSYKWHLIHSPLHIM